MTAKSVGWWPWFVILNDNLPVIGPMFGIGISSTRVHIQNRRGKGYTVPDAGAILSWTFGEWTCRASCVMELYIDGFSAFCTSISGEIARELLTASRHIYREDSRSSHSDAQSAANLPWRNKPWLQDATLTPTHPVTTEDRAAGESR